MGKTWVIPEIHVMFWSRTHWPEVVIQAAETLGFYVTRASPMTTPRSDIVLPDVTDAVLAEHQVSVLHVTGPFPSSDLQTRVVTTDETFEAQSRIMIMAQLVQTLYRA